MQPTLKKGSLIFGVRIFNELETGDIIVFTKDGQLLLKRIAATAGEMITVDRVSHNIIQGFNALISFL